MSGTGSPADHAATDVTQPKTDAPASAPSADAGQPGGTDAKSPVADPSPAADEGAKKDAKPTLLEVLTTAADQPTDQGKSPDPAKTGKDKVDPAPIEAAPETDADKIEAEDKKLSFHNHPRWQEVVGQNKSLRDQVKTLEPDADQYRKIDGFMREHKLTPDEVGDLFIVGAMAKAGDPRVLQKIDEFRNKVALAIGEELPPDIRERMEVGEVSEAAAKELAKARATATITERQLAEREAADKNAEAERAKTAIATSQAAAVQAWDVEKRKTDPDFAKKEKAIARYARALMQEHGAPRDTKEALNLVNAAYAEVNRDFAQALPPKTAVTRVPIAPSTNGAKVAPKTLREAMEQAAAM